MPRGGTRSGAGRKKGSTNKPSIPAHQRAKAIAYKALESDDTPLQIMLEASRFFVSEARRVRAVPGMREVQADVEGEKPIVISAHAMYVAAADCARKAAPFVHPQLSAVEHKVNERFESAVLSLDEAARQALEEGGAAHKVH